MISTVTTATASTITSAMIAGSIVLIAILVLLFLLVQKQLAASVNSVQYKRLSKVANIGIVPLLMAFLVVVVIRVAEVLK